jgi:nitrogen fixation NifU-like protein
MTKDAKTLYQEVIVDHGKAPRNEGALEGATHQATVKNPLCGDRVTLRLVVRDGTIVDTRFEARGCMIARASASLLTETVRECSTTEARALAHLVSARIDPNGPAATVPPSLEALSGAREFPARRACVALAWKALLSALDG